MYMMRKMGKAHQRDFDMIESLIFGLVILAITSLWVLIEQRNNPKFLIWFIPLLLILVSSTYVTYTSISVSYTNLTLPKICSE